MFNLKSIYFYFLAVQITLIKFIKKVYFSTNYYNSDLISKTPQQFYFYPSPFLLSTLTNFKNYSFKISEIDPNLFWVKQKDLKRIKELHSFFWLVLIDRKNDGKAIQKIIKIWIQKYSKYKNNIWENSITSKRIISWILNADIILNNGLFDFKRNFLTIIVKQANHLKKNIKFEKNLSKKLEMLSALLLTGLVFKEYEDYYNTAIKELEKLVKNFFDNDGFPLTRNPGDLIFFTKYLIFCKECVKDAQKYVPEFLNDIIDKSLLCERNILTPKNQMPLFNGSNEEDLEQFNKLTDNFNISSKDKKNVIGGIKVLKFKNNYVFFDIGAPPDKGYSKSYQSGPLSFEYYVEGAKIITNCGFGNKISAKAEFLSRLTSAQSTLTINNTSITKFERNKLVNKIFGNSIKNSFKVTNFDFLDDKNITEATAAHNGYEKNFGCVHKRKICINKETKNLMGIDEIIKNKDGKPLNFDIRFHLYPGLTAVKTMSGNSVLIQLNKNKSLIFTVKDEVISLEKSIFFGSNRVLDNVSITISGNLVNKNKLVQWELKRNN